MGGACCRQSRTTDSIREQRSNAPSSRSQSNRQRGEANGDSEEESRVQNPLLESVVIGNDEQGASGRQGMIQRLRQTNNGNSEYSSELQRNERDPRHLNSYDDERSGITGLSASQVLRPPAHLADPRNLENIPGELDSRQNGRLPQKYRPPKKRKYLLNDSALLSNMSHETRAKVLISDEPILVRALDDKGQIYQTEEESRGPSFTQARNVKTQQAPQPSEPPSEKEASRKAESFRNERTVTGYESTEYEGKSESQENNDKSESKPPPRITKKRSFEKDELIESQKRTSFKLWKDFRASLNLNRVEVTCFGQVLVPMEDNRAFYLSSTTFVICFFSEFRVVFYSLAHITPFAMYFTNQMHLREVNLLSEDIVNGPSIAMGQFVNFLWTILSDGKEMEPRFFFDKVEDNFPELLNGEKQDASEFYHLLLEKLEEVTPSLQVILRPVESL